MKLLAAVFVLAGAVALSLQAAEKLDAKKAHLTSIPGINEAIEAKLNAAGVNNVNDLLAEGGSPQSRKEMAARTGLTAEQLLKFVHCADLFRIKGIGAHAAALLQSAAVNTVAELAQRDAARLHAALQQINNAKKGSARLPTEQQLAEWIAEAKTLPKSVTTD